MNIWKWFKMNAVGVDLGSRTIKGVKLRKKGELVYLDRYFFHDLAHDSAQYPEGVKVGESLKANVELSKLTHERAAVNLRDDEVLSFNFSLPRMKESEARVAIGHEIEESLNIPADDLAFDYVKAENTADESGDTQSYKAYCTRKQNVAQLADVLRGSRLRPAAVESEMQAVMAMLEFNDYLEAGRNYAVFDLGESHITMSLVANLELKLVKAARTGFGSINRALQDGLNVDYSRAEAMKLEHDFNEEIENDTQTEKIIDDVYFQMFKLVKEAVELFNEQLTPGTKLDRILLVGGGSQTESIEKVFELLFKTPTTVVNPLRNIQIYGSATAANTSSKDEKIGQIGAYLGTAVGLALREIN